MTSIFPQLPTSKNRKTTAYSYLFNDGWNNVRINDRYERALYRYTPSRQVYTPDTRLIETFENIGLPVTPKTHVDIIRARHEVKNDPNLQISTSRRSIMMTPQASSSTLQPVVPIQHDDIRLVPRDPPTQPDVPKKKKGLRRILPKSIFKK